MFPEAHAQVAYLIVSLNLLLSKGRSCRPTKFYSRPTILSKQLLTYLRMCNPPVFADAEIDFERHR